MARPSTTPSTAAAIVPVFLWEDALEPTAPPFGEVTGGEGDELDEDVLGGFADVFGEDWVADVVKVEEKDEVSLDVVDLVV